MLYKIRIAFEFTLTKLFAKFTLNSAFNKLNACLHDVIEPKCGTDAYEVSRVLFKASFSRLPYITCAKYEYNSKTCGALLPPAGTQPKGPKSHSVLSKLFSSFTGT